MFIWDIAFFVGLVPVVYLLVNAFLSRHRGSVGRAPPADPRDVTIVVPVHAERPERFAECLRSVTRDGCRVIVVGDGVDEPYRTLATEAGAEFVGLAERGGKKRALAAGVHQVSTEFVLFVDSDTEIPEHAVRDLSTYFEAGVGGVGANLYVRPNGSLAARCSEFVERAREVVLRAMSSRGNVLYLDGACMMFRTDVVRPYVLSDDFQHLTVLGRPTRLGDDWQLTDHVLRQGLRTVKAYSVGAITERPESLAAFVRQNVRWSRSSWIRLGRYLSGNGPQDPGLFYRLELAGTYALPLLALALGIVRLPLYVHLGEQFLALLGASLNGFLRLPYAAHGPLVLRFFLSAETLIGLVAAGTFSAAVARRLPPGDRARTLAAGLLGTALLFPITIYGLLTFWRSPVWQGRTTADSAPGAIPTSALATPSVGKAPLLRR